MSIKRAVRNLIQWVSSFLAMAPFFVCAQDDTNSASSSRFSDKPAPLLDQKFFDRPPPLLEWGDKFLGAGNLQKGFTLPTGANWTPDFWIYGDFRTAIQTFDAGNDTRVTEWANRLDLFANLQLSGTERILLGIRPLDENGLKYSGYLFEPHTSNGWVNALNLVPRTLFFEGEFGQIFPSLTGGGKYNLDYGFSIGRQPLLLQDGLLVNDDSIDLFGVTANALHFPYVPTARLTALFAWGEMERAHNQEDPHAMLVGLDSAADTAWDTLEATALYVPSNNRGDGFYSGIGTIQRIGRFNTVFRVANSVALQQTDARVSSGTLLFSEISFDPHGSHDLVYLNAFYGIDRFAAADLAPSEGGPLDRLGILNASVNLGSYGAPLNNFPEHAAGANLGYQIYYGAVPRTQLVLEIGGRCPTATPTVLQDQPAEGIAARFQKNYGKRFVIVLDAFGVLRQNENSALGGSSQLSWGGRVEFMTKF
jgi:hypothetical protein